MPGQWNAGRLPRFGGSDKRQFPKLNLVERDTGCIYARFVAGRLLWIDADVLAGASIDAETHAARYAAAPEIFSVPWPRHGLA